MADLTVSFNATGTINGRTYSLAHSFVMEDIVGYARKADDRGTTTGNWDMGDGFATDFLNDPEIVIFGSKGKDATGFTFSTSGGNVKFTIPPGEFGMLVGESNTMLDITTTATSTILAEVEGVTSGPLDNHTVDTKSWAILATT